MRAEVLVIAGRDQEGRNASDGKQGASRKRVHVIVLFIAAG
jgi:hypothetical protein